ncbi:MAG: DUF488 family protein [Firmicutes bacterium]|nr:DUF488 family protein [Bacillota bacterium]
MIRVKRVYDPPSLQDGLRVLVTTFWPRGVRKTSVDQWIKALGTPKPLLNDYRHGALSFEAFAAEYRKFLKGEQQQKEITRLVDWAKAGDLTLLTSFRDLEHSHVIILRNVVEEQLTRTAP